MTAYTVNEEMWSV